MAVTSRRGPSRSSARSGTARLTPREREILAQVATGGTYEEVAHRLGLSVQTVKNHMTRIYGKLEVPSLVLALHRVGWLKVPAGPDADVGRAS